MRHTIRAVNADTNLIIFAGACALLVYFLFFHEQFLLAVHLDTVVIAPIMAFGSFVAGSTCLGGGAVAFPALTKYMQIDPFTAKTFSLAIQSVGMTSASIFILHRVKYLPWRFIAFYLVGSTVGILVCLFFLDRLIQSSDTRIVFSLMMLCFMFIFVVSAHRKLFVYEQIQIKTKLAHILIMLTGVIGGVTTGFLGSGADLAAFCLLTLYFHSNIKTATQTSVLIMAFNSLIGIATQGLVLDNVPVVVWPLWVVAAPVVILGAPIGALFCRHIPQRALFWVVVVLICLEVITTVWLVPFSSSRIKYYGMIAAVMFLVFILLDRFPHSKHYCPDHR